MADPPPVLTLRVENGPREGKTLQRRAGAVGRVGRVVRGNHLAVDDDGASQRHLDLEFLPPPAARWAVTDVDSSNGTLLNGAPLVPHVPAPLSDGDVIKIGESTVLAVTISADAGPYRAVTKRSARQEAAVAVKESKAPAVARRGGRRKAAVPAEPPEAEEEAVAVTRRGGRNKAAEPPEVETKVEEEDEEAAAVTRRGRKKAASTSTAALPLQPQKTMSVRSAATREEAVGTEHDEREPEKTGGGRRRVTRASAKKTAGPVLEEDEEEDAKAEAAVLGEQREHLRRLTAANGSEEASVACRGRAGRTRRGRGRVTRASACKTKDAVIEEDNEKEKEEVEVAAARELTWNPPQVTAVKCDGEEEDKVATRGGEVDGASKLNPSVEEEDVLVARRGGARRSQRGMANAQPAAVDNGGKDTNKGEELSREEGNNNDQELGGGIVPQSEVDGVEEEDGTVMGGGSGKEGIDRNVTERSGRSILDNMTLGEWFNRMEVYLLAKNHEAAEKAIAEVIEIDRRFCEYVSSPEFVSSTLK